VLSRDQRFLFVAMTRGNCVWRMPIMADGSVSKAGQFFTSHGPSGPDGLALDPHGRLIVCNPGLGVAWILDEYAEPVQILQAGRGISLTNVAVHDSGMAYFTDSTNGRILRTQL
jgi:gluconolactonase